MVVNPAENRHASSVGALLTRAMLFAMLANEKRRAPPSLCESERNDSSSPVIDVQSRVGRHDADGDMAAPHKIK